MPFLKFEWVEDPKEEVREIVLFKGSSGEHPRVKYLKKVIGEKKSFILDWEKELGYTGNPFQDKIFAPVDSFMTGFKDYKEKLNLFIINNHKFGRISGDRGSGKTILLRWLYEQLHGHEDKLIAVFIDSRKLTYDFSLIKTIVEPLLSVYDTKVHKLHKNTNFERNLEVLKDKLGGKKLVLLMDNFDAVTKNNIATLNRLYNVIQLQIVVCQNKKPESSSEIEDKDKLKMHIKGLAYDELKEMVKKRIGYFSGKGIYPFDDKNLKSIYKKSESNPRLFLELCNKRAIELAVKFIGKPKPEETDEEIIEKAEKEEEPKTKGFLPEEPVQKKAEYKIKEVKQGTGEVVVHKE